MNVMIGILTMRQMSEAVARGDGEIIIAVRARVLPVLLIRARLLICLRGLMSMGGKFLRAARIPWRIRCRIFWPGCWAGTLLGNLGGSNGQRDMCFFSSPLLDWSLWWTVSYYNPFLHDSMDGSMIDDDSTIFTSSFPFWYTIIHIMNTT